MEKHIVKIIDIEDVTYNIKRFTIEKPMNYSFLPGQATEVAINKPGYENENRPIKRNTVIPEDVEEILLNRSAA